jgi:hypothetical protein
MTNHAKNPPVVRVENTEIPVIVYQNQRVITSELLAEVYGTAASNIHDNYRKNRRRFESGKHFHKLEGETLREFKNALTGIFPVSGNLRHLILWTERGASRHAKMLDTDQAWSVFDKLEVAYFEAEFTSGVKPEIEASSTSHISASQRSRVLLTFENGVVVESVPVPDDVMLIPSAEVAALWHGLTADQGRALNRIADFCKATGLLSHMDGGWHDG